ncbi:glycosyltransferase [Baekduia alba]|uniref:hypothetical protein n=1 Tax=Baekduia alba TaxID=2997333 RepID=UPI002341BB74|nr:hypothetical protein [Baekduia alba]WCB91878.1 glycosyltransferase [Baekduia alba]
MKIGAVYNTGVSNAHYRAIWPLAGLEQRGHEVGFMIEGADGGLDPRPLEGCDVVHVYRTGNPVLAKALVRFRRQGTAVVFDNDDDHRLMPHGTPDREKYVGFTGQREFRFQAQMMKRADVLTTTTARLAERFAHEFDGPIEVIENHLAPFQFAKDRHDHDGILIGWVAAQEHRADVQQLRLTEMLRRVMERDKRIRVETLGVRLHLDPSRYNFAGVVPFERLADHIGRFDIGIAPIADHPMSHVRSNVKVKEYAAAGVPWVASARGSYLSLGRNCGGVIVADDAWEDTLVDLAGSRLKRRLMRRQAQAWAKTQRIENHLDRWEAVMNLAVESAARQVVA